MSIQVDSGSRSLHEFKDIGERVSVSRVCNRGRANGNLFFICFRNSENESTSVSQYRILLRGRTSSTPISQTFQAASNSGGRTTIEGYLISMYSFFFAASTSGWLQTEWKTPNRISVTRARLLRSVYWGNYLFRHYNLRRDE